MTMERVEAQDALVVTTVDGPTYWRLHAGARLGARGGWPDGAYTRAATALSASVPALARHVLGGVAPTLAVAAIRIAATPAATGSQEGLRRATTLPCGDVIVGEHARSALRAARSALRAHAAGGAGA